MSIASVKAELASVLRDYVVEGLPVSGPNEPEKQALRMALSNLADLAATSGTTLVYGTVAEMTGATAPTDVGARAEVRADAAGDVEDGNGVYGWTGSAWAWIGPLMPASVATAITDQASLIQKAAAFQSMLSGFHPTAERPSVFMWLTETLAFIDVYPHASNYRGGKKRRMGDKVRFWLKDAGPFMGITHNLTVIGKTACYGGREQPILTSIYNDKIGDVTDTGQMPTALRPPICIGEYTAPGSVTGYDWTGDFHGRKAHINQGLTGTLNDASTGWVDVTTNLLDWPIGVPWQGTKILLSGTFSAMTTSGKIAARLDEADFFESADGWCWRYSGVFDFGHASVNCTPGVSALNAAVGCASELDRAVGIVNGVPGQWSHNGVPMTEGGQPVKVLKLLNRDNEIYNPGAAEKMIQFDSHFPDIKDETRVGVAYGMAYRVDGVWTALDTGVPLQDRADPGPKWGAQSEGSSGDATSFAGKTLTLDQFNTVAFDPETYA